MGSSTGEGKEGVGAHPSSISCLERAGGDRTSVAPTCLGVPWPEQDPPRVLALPGGDPSPGGTAEPFGGKCGPSTRPQAGTLCSGGSPSCLGTFLSFSSRCDTVTVVTVEQSQRVQEDLGLLQGVSHTLVLLGLQTKLTNRVTLPLSRADLARLGLKSQHHISSVRPARSSACHSLLSSVPFPSNPG